MKRFTALLTGLAFLGVLFCVSSLKAEEAAQGSPVREVKTFGPYSSFRSDVDQYSAHHLPDAECYAASQFNLKQRPSDDLMVLSKEAWADIEAKLEADRVKYMESKTAEGWSYEGRFVTGVGPQTNSVTLIPDVRSGYACNTCPLDDKCLTDFNNQWGNIIQHRGPWAGTEKYDIKSNVKEEHVSHNNIVYTHHISVTLTITGTEGFIWVKPYSDDLGGTPTEDGLMVSEVVETTTEGDDVMHSEVIDCVGLQETYEDCVACCQGDNACETTCSDTFTPMYSGY